MLFTCILILYLQPYRLHNKEKRTCNYMFKIQKGYDTESKTFRLPISLIERMEVLAAKNKISLNQLVIQSLNYAIDNLEETEIINDKVEK